MQLQTKMFVMTGAIVATIVLSAGIAHRYINEANNLSNMVTENRIPVVMYSRDMRSEATRSIQALESYILFGAIDPVMGAKYRAEREQTMAGAETAFANIERASATFNLGPEAGRLEDLRSQLSTLKGLEEKIEEMNEAKTSEGTAQAYDMLQKQVMPLETNLFETVSEFSRSQEKTAADEGGQLRDANHTTIVVLWIGTLIASLIGITVSVYLGRRLAYALSEVMTRADAIAAGDLSGQPLELHTNDQTGSLGKAVQKMQSNLSGILGTVASTVGTLTGSAAAMRSSSDQMHRRIDQQSQQTQQAATAMQEMSASIAEVSRHTQSAAETARSAAETAREGGTIVKQVLGSMHSIATAVSDTSATVGLLGDDSRKISQIVTVIDEIARKTNLLALNAAIEAARAGDQGRGFAVVAGEVRRLAESTAQATGEIANMIQGIQDRTLSAIASMESGTGTVQQGVLTTTQAGEALERIIGMAERVDRMIAQIAIAASQQTVAADQSSASLDSIHSLSQENLNEMETVAHEVESLRMTATALEQQVDRFSLKSSQETRVMPAGGSGRFSGFQHA